MSSSMSRLIHYLPLLLSCLLFVHADLQSDLSGKGFTVLFPGDSGYSSASQAYNSRYTFSPAAVAFPTTPDQVSTAVKAGAANSYQVVARSGGHSYIANGLGGKNNAVVVDLKNFNSITIDSSSNTAVIGTGNRLGDIAVALNNQGRAIPHGTCPYVGVGGHSAYGGFGFTSRMWGLTLDTILSINVVLANGTIATASSTVNSDLFWALRGSAGSYGITTSIQVKTFPAPAAVSTFTYNWELSSVDAANAIGSFQTYVQTNIPAQLGAELVLSKGSASGKVVLGLTGGWYGAANQLGNILSPFLGTMPQPRDSTVTPGNYINSISYFSGGASLNTGSAADGHDTFYAKSLMTPQSSPMSDTARKAFTAFLANDGFSSTTNWFMQLELYGGQNSAINAVDADATSFAHRSSMFTIQLYASSPNYAPPYPAAGFTFLDGAVNSIINNSPSGWDYGAYSNYVDDRLQDWQQRYYGAHYARLNTLKTTYDPQGTFSFPTAIQATTTTTTTQNGAIHPNGNTAKCLDVSGAVFANGTPVQIYDCNGTPAQQWTVTRGTTTQVRVSGTTYCLDAGSAPANGIGMKIWTCYDGLAAQTWSYGTDNHIALSTQGQCLDLTNGVLTNGNVLQTWQCTAGNTNQVWTM